MIHLVLLALILAGGCSRPPTESPQAEGKPVAVAASALEFSQKFAEEFANPPNAYRLDQYTLNDETLKKYPEYGIGGFLAFFYQELYQQEPDAAKKIGPAVEAAHERGMKVWLADDFGYPSGMAGGRVVEENPDYEVRGLAMETVDGAGPVPAVCELPDGAERFVAATLYPLVDGEPDLSGGQVVPVTNSRVETTGLPGPWRLCAFAAVIRDRETQAQSTMAQFKHSGRYPDLLNPDATDRFLAHMHEPILAQINDPASKVEGFYTNEPDVKQLHWNDGESPFACAPWNAEIPARFRQMHGYPLAPVLAALYEGDGIEARRVRIHFQQTVAQMFTENWAGRVREWCNARGVRSSGHLMWNEYLSMHVACYGDLMKFAAEFDVPAADIGIPNPPQFRDFPYEQTRFYSSVAAWKGQEEIILLLDPIIDGGGLRRLSPAMPLLYNSANWGFFHGANQLTSYLPLDPVDTPDTHATGYTPEEYRAFNEYIGRISLLLRGAWHESSVALYYPIAMFQADYRPSRQRWTKIIELHAKRQHDWERIEKTLLAADLDYQIVHPEAVAGAAIEDGHLRIGRGSYRVLVMPPMDLLPLEALHKIEAFEAAGGKVVWVDEVPSAAINARDDEAIRQGLADARPVAAGELPASIGQSVSPSLDLTFTPGTSELGVARFHRDGKKIYFVMNKTEKDLPAEAGGSGEVTVMDPSTGEIRMATAPLPLQIGPLRSMLLVQ